MTINTKDLEELAQANYSKFDILGTRTWVPRLRDRHLNHFTTSGQREEAHVG